MTTCLILPLFINTSVAIYLPTSCLVGMTGFEPAALWSQTRCATKLRYIPIYVFFRRLKYNTIFIRINQIQYSSFLRHNSSFSLIFYHFRRGTLFFYHGENNSDHISDRIKYIFSALLFKKASRLFPAYACKNCAEIGSHSLCRKNIGAGISNDQRSAYP